MMAQASSMRDDLALVARQVDAPAIAATSQTMSDAGASKTIVREEGLTILSDGINPVAE
jgi:hypothetical protein